MLVVMLMLLAATAAGTFAAHTSTAELRSAAAVQRMMQVQYVSEIGLVSTLALVDTLGPAALLHSIEQTRLRGLTPTLAPFEPNYLPTQEGYRVFLADFGPFATNLPVTAGSVGPIGLTYAPTFVVDVNDTYTYTGTIPGQRADGHGRLQYLHATYTSRGRMALIAGDVASPGDPRRYHEAANDARARGLSGPFGR